jgi:hypothetical protein
MKGLGFLLSLGLCFVMSLACLGQDPKPDFREDLKTAIPEGIRMLEAKEYVAFIKAFVEPELLKKIIGNGPIEKFAEIFGKAKAESLLNVLQQIKDQQPELKENGTKAVFKIKDPVNGKDEIKFNKIEKFWYIDN